jgi:histidinol phosphatase-like PHP family hydrolase
MVETTSVHLAGSLRRSVELSSDIDFVVEAKTPAGAIARIATMPRVASVETRSDTECRLRLANGTRVDVLACTSNELPAALAHGIAAPAHLARLVAVAADHGLRLTPQGLFHWEKEHEKRVALRDEAQLYAKLGLAWGPPEMREDAHYAGGLDVERLKRQWDEIDEVQEKVKIKILRGTEADIIADGAVDWPDAILERLDVVIASIHTRFRQAEAKMTERVLRAMRHPVFKIWGHPMGCLVSSRPPIPLRIEEVLDALAESRGAIEISGDPHRLDMEPKLARLAKERGIPFVLSVDAHAMRELDNVRYAIGLARRAGVQRQKVLNARSAAAFARAVKPAAGKRAA